MKCKICGHRTQTIKAMRSHYIKDHPQGVFKDHPQAMKRKKSKQKSLRVQERLRDGEKFCPYCGARL